MGSLSLPALGSTVWKEVGRPQAALWVVLVRLGFSCPRRGLVVPNACFYIFLVSPDLAFESCSQSGFLNILVDVWALRCYFIELERPFSLVLWYCRNIT
jgi:hypothetical protein